jgi:ATP-dependent DNA helicase RecG
VLKVFANMPSLSAMKVGAIFCLVSQMTAFSNVSEASHTFFQKLGFRLDLTEVTHPSGRVLVFGIPARPVGVPLEFKGRYLMRVGQSLTSMTQDRLLSIFN